MGEINIISREAKDDQTPQEFLKALECGNTKLVLALLAKGTDPNTNDNGITPLNTAAWIGDTRLVQLLLNAGAKPDPTDTGEPPLFTAIWKGHMAVVDVLLKAGANPNSKNKWGHTALTYAITKHQGPIVKLLLDAGVEIDRAITTETPPMECWTPLMLATWEGLYDIACDLISRGADVNATDGGGRTAMHGAAWHGHLDLIAALRQAGGDLFAKSNDGHTPAFYAQQNGQKEIAFQLMLLELEARRLREET